MEEILLQSKDLYKSYNTGKTIVPVINGINLTLYKSDFTVIMGSSGSGKSTLLYLLSGLEVPSSGEIWLEDKPVHTLDEKMMTLIRRKYIGFVFQDFNLVPNLTFLENILIPAYLVKNDRQQIKDRALDLMQKMKIKDLKDRLPSEVSGGQQQRCSMARAIINNPDLVMADEPTGNLNSSSSEAVLDILSELNNIGQSIVMVTHEVKSACRANRIIFLRDGHIEDDLRFDKDLKFEEKEVQLLKWLAGKDW